MGVRRVVPFLVGPAHGVGPLAAQHVLGLLAQVDREEHLALRAAARMDPAERRPVRPDVAGHRGAEGRLGVLERPVGAFRPALEGLPRGGRQVREERLVAVLRVAREAAVDAAALLRQIGAAPVQDRQDVDHPVPGLQMGLHGVRQRHARVGAELRVLLRGVEPHVAAGHHPQHVVRVQGDVPLHVARPVLQDVLVVAAQRRRDRRVHVAVPFGRSMVALPGCTSSSSR